MGIVVDDFGSAIGILTMEDVFEEVVGEIDVGYDFEEYLPPDQERILDRLAELGDDALYLVSEGFGNAIGSGITKVGEKIGDGELLTASEVDSTGAPCGSSSAAAMKSDSTSGKNWKRMKPPRTTPTTINSPASDGMATTSMTPPNKTITTAITPAA